MYGTVRTVVWEDGGSNSASYPIYLKRRIPGGRILSSKHPFTFVAGDFNDGNRIVIVTRYAV